jgi:flagellar hook-associated protein 2
MTGIQSSMGLISGIPIQDTVDKLISVSARPRDRLLAINKVLQDKQVAIGQLTALVIGVQLSTDPLGKPNVFQQNRVQSSAPAVAASISGTAIPGRYQVVPLQQAQQQQYTSSLLASAEQRVGSGEITIHGGGFLDTSLTLDELNGGAGVQRGQIRITDRSGASQQVDLRNALSASDVVQAINSTSGLRVTARMDGDRFVLTDASGGTGTLSVSEVGGGVTARDLGLANISVSADTATGADVVSLTRSTSLRSLLDGRGVVLGGALPSLHVQLRDGSTVTVSTDLKATSASVGQLLDAINTAGDGKLKASISPSGESLQLEDLTSGGNTFSASSSHGNLATALGWNQGAGGGATISGVRLQSGLGDVLLSSLGGGKGLGTLGELTLTDRSGAQATVNLGGARTVGDVLSAINAAGLGVTARLNDSRTGIALVDTSGGTAGPLAATSGDGSDTAAKLGLSAGSDPARLSGASLGRQWVHENSLLKTWNQGKDLPLSNFTITNSLGAAYTVNLGSFNPKTIGDVIQAINNTTSGVRAELNDTGDGLRLIDEAGGAGTLTVQDAGSGTTAKQLGIAGSAKTLMVNNQTIQGIDGSRTLKISTTDSTTVQDLVGQINELGGSVRANLVNLGGGSGVRLALTSSASGAAGRVSLEVSELALGFSETAAARDALMALGGSDSGGGILLSSNTDTFNNAIEGVTLSINSVSTSPVTIEVKKNEEALTKQLSTMVEQVNKVRDKLKEYTGFDSTSFRTGLLFGSTESLRIDMAINNLFGGRFSGTGSIKSLGELGISFNDQGKLTFDQKKFQAALERDPAAVQDFFNTAETGFAARAKSVIDGLSGVKSGLLLKRNEALQSTIELNGRRLESMNERLDRERTRLLQQFYRMEEAIAAAQRNMSTIANLKPLEI